MNKQDLLNVTDGEVLKALISAMPPYELRIMYYELGSLLREHPEQTGRHFTSTGALA